MARMMLALVALVALQGCGQETEAETTPAFEALDLTGTWETPDNSYKWQLRNEGGELAVHGWDQTTGRAFRTYDVLWNGKVLTFGTIGPTSTMGELEHTFKPSEGDKDIVMAVHSEGESLGTLDWEMTRVPGTGPVAPVKLQQTEEEQAEAKGEQTGQAEGESEASQ